MKDDPISNVVAAFGVVVAVIVSLLPERIDFSFVFTIQAAWMNGLVLVVALVSKGDRKRIEKATIAGAITGFVGGIVGFAIVYAASIL